MLKLNLPTASETSSLRISYTSQNPHIFKIGDLNKMWWTKQTLYYDWTLKKISDELKCGLKPVFQRYKNRWRGKLWPDDGQAQFKEFFSWYFILNSVQPFFPFAIERLKFCTWESNLCYTHTLKNVGNHSGKTTVLEIHVGKKNDAAFVSNEKAMREAMFRGISIAAKLQNCRERSFDSFSWKKCIHSRGA